ncbi:MAG: L-aspartate oxidase [Bacteroidetes bacterium]|nr:L-aspartate oxidase [Bacteroidota bacterium]
MNTDFLIIGSGIAGLTFALKVARKLPGASVTLVTKGDESETNTKYAQGGIAVVTDLTKDDYAQHINDTITAGDGLCDETIVRMVINEAPARLQELIDLGVEFDREPGGQLDLGREGGHSQNRIVHHKDITGQEVERALLKQIHSLPNIKIVSHCYAVDLITEHHLGKEIARGYNTTTCFGAYVLDPVNNRIEKILSKITMLATGGAGQVYRYTTNPLIATGDGIGMAYRAKGVIENMEFVQFHPTALFKPGENPMFLISEAVRGKGAILKNKDGGEFMNNYDKQRELAPRDIVARAIDSELKARGDDFIYLDCAHFPAGQFAKNFPNIFRACMDIGIDPSKDRIPVVPAAHFVCGGIKTDDLGRTSINHLYACGECASTGLHGANRLASNSLLEAVVFSHRAFTDASGKVENINLNSAIPEWNEPATTKADEMVLITQTIADIKSIMSNYVGIVRNDLRLSRGLSRLRNLFKEVRSFYNTNVLSPQLCELRNMVTVALLITRSAYIRDENRGLHFNKDHVKNTKSQSPR